MGGVVTYQQIRPFGAQTARLARRAAHVRRLRGPWAIGVWVSAIGPRLFDIYSQSVTTHFATLQREIIDCRLCPRLVAWREEVALTKRRAYRSETYWGRPVPAFGDPLGRLLVVGLAPGAHGANRTGRQFTGDGSGAWLMRALHRAGFASQATSEHREDGLVLRDCLITSAVRCVPPKNKPTQDEARRCRGYLTQEFLLLAQIRVIVALGHIAWRTVLQARVDSGVAAPKPRPAFGHGVVFSQGGAPALLGSYHPSRLNTQTGRLTEAMLDGVFTEAADLMGHPPGGRSVAT